MRDPNRIPRIAAVLQRVWQAYPELRLGQLLVNASANFEHNGFNIEDEPLEQDLLEFERLMGLLQKADA